MLKDCLNVKVNRFNYNNYVCRVKFNFKKELINHGFHRTLVEQWLQVRKTKRATNTMVAFNKFISEVNKCPYDRNDILRQIVENSWSGFKADWLKNKTETNDTISTYEQRLKRFGY